MHIIFTIQPGLWFYKCLLAIALTLASNAGFFIGVLTVKNGFSNIYVLHISKPSLRVTSIVYLP